MRYLSALAPLFVFSYFRFFARPQLIELMGSYGDYWFEVIFCGLALMLYPRELKIKFQTKLFKGFSIALVAGFLTLIIGKHLLGLVIPFQVREVSGILLLVLWGPILEEFLFRFALYWPLRSSLNKKWAAVITTVFFSYCHFHAYSLVPEALKLFVIFQSVYTLILGAWWVLEYQKEQNLLAPLGLHISFNLGFFLALVLW